MYVSKNQFRAGDAVIITDIHPLDVHFAKKDLLVSKKAFILATPDPRWQRSHKMKDWYSLPLKIGEETYWFWAVKVEKETDTYFITEDDEKAL